MHVMLKRGEAVFQDSILCEDVVYDHYFCL